MEYQILIEAVTRFGVVNTPHGMGVFLWQQIEPQQVDGDAGLQVLIGTTGRQRQQVQSRPIAHGPALHVFLIDDLDFDIDLLTRIQGASHVEAGQFFIVTVRDVFRRREDDVRNRMAQVFSGDGIEKINGNEFPFRPAEDELEQDVIHGIEVLFRQLREIRTIADFVGSQFFFQQIHHSFFYYIMKQNE